MHGVIRVGRARVGRARVGRSTLTDNGRAKFFHGRCAAGPRINENNNRDILGSVVCKNNNIGKKNYCSENFINDSADCHPSTANPTRRPQ